MKTKKMLLFACLLAMGRLYAAEPAAHRPTGERLAHACGGCHGTFGRSLVPTPVLAGKPEQEFLAMMRDFKSGQRASSVMNRLARGYADEDFAAMAKFFKNQPAGVP